MYNKLAIILTALLISRTVHASEKELERVLSAKCSQWLVFNDELKDATSVLQIWNARPKTLPRMYDASREQGVMQAHREVTNSCIERWTRRCAFLIRQKKCLYEFIASAQTLMTNLEKARHDSNQDQVDACNKKIATLLAEQTR